MVSEVNLAWEAAAADTSGRQKAWSDVLMGKKEDRLAMGRATLLMRHASLHSTSGDGTASAYVTLFW